MHEGLPIAPQVRTSLGSRELSRKLDRALSSSPSALACAVGMWLRVLPLDVQRAGFRRLSPGSKNQARACAFSYPRHQNITQAMGGFSLPASAMLKGDACESTCLQPCEDICSKVIPQFCLKGGDGWQHGDARGRSLVS